MINLKKPHKTQKYQILDNSPIVVNKKKKIKISADSLLLITWDRKSEMEAVKC